MIVKYEQFARKPSMRGWLKARFQQGEMSVRPLEATYHTAVRSLSFPLVPTLLMMAADFSSTAVSKMLLPMLVQSCLNIRRLLSSYEPRTGQPCCFFFALEYRSTVDTYLPLPGGVLISFVVPAAFTHSFLYCTPILLDLYNTAVSLSSEN